LNSVPVFGVQTFAKRKENNVQARPSVSIKKSTSGTRRVKGRDGKYKSHTERIGLALYYYNTIFLNKANDANEKGEIDWVDGGVHDLLTKVQYKDKNGVTVADPYIRMDLPTYYDEDGNSKLDDQSLYDLDKKLSVEEQQDLSEDDLPYELGQVDGNTLNFRNVEHFIKGGAKLTGLLNAVAAVSSKQGLSTPFKIEFAVVKQSSGRRVKPRAVFSQAELDFAADDTTEVEEDYFDDGEDPLAQSSSALPVMDPPSGTPVEGVESSAPTPTEDEAAILARMEAATQSRRGDA